MVTKHAHKWFLAQYVAPKPVKEYLGTARYGMSMSTGEFYPSYSTFVCECGAKKTVMHKKEKS